MTQTSMIKVDLSTLGPVAFDTLQAQVEDFYATVLNRQTAAADSLHRANGEKGRTRVWGTEWPQPIADTIAQVEADPSRPVRGRINVTAGDALADYRNAVKAVEVIAGDLADMLVEYNRRPWPRYVVTQGHNAHIHSGSTCSTLHRGRERTRLGWLVDLSGNPIEQCIDTFQATMCTVCYPDAPVIRIEDPKACKGTIKEGTKRQAGSSMRGVNVWADCTCGKSGVKVKDDGTMTKHAPAPTSRFAQGDRVTHAGDPGRVWVVQEVDTTGRLAKLKVTAEGGKAVRNYLDVDCSAAPAVEAPAAAAVPMRAQVEQQHQGADVEPAAGRGEPSTLCGVPAGFAGERHDFEVRGTDTPTTLNRCGRPAGDPIHAGEQPATGAQVEAPATLVPTFAPFDEIEHPSKPGVVLVVDHVTPAGRVVAHPDGALDQTGRYLAAKCRLMRAADQVYAGKTVDEKTADLMAVALRATLTHTKADLDRLRALVGRYGITVKGSGHVHDSTGYNITQGMPDLARMLSGNRSFALRTVRAGEPEPGTWAELAGRQEREGDIPRVTLPCGLGGRASLTRTVAATERYCVMLRGFGVGDIEGGITFVDAGAQALEDVDRLLRGNVRFVRALERRQVEDIRTGALPSPNSLGRDAWLATIPVHLERGYGEGPVWCPEEAPARVVMVRTDATCRECEQAIAFHQFAEQARSDQAEGRPVRDADGLIVPVGVDVATVEQRMFYAGRVRGHCGHYLPVSERRAGLRNCERCPAHPEPCGFPDNTPCVCKTGSVDQDATVEPYRAPRAGDGRHQVDVVERPTGGTGCLRCGEPSTWVAAPVEGDPNAGSHEHVYGPGLASVLGPDGVAQGVDTVQLFELAEVDQLAGRRLLDGLGEPLEVEGVEVTADYRMFWAGRVVGGCGHPVALSEYRAGMTNCERCPVDGDQDDDVAGECIANGHEQPNAAGECQRCGGAVDQDDDDQDGDTEPARTIARYSRQSATLAVGPEGAPDNDLQWLTAGGPWERDGALSRAGWARVGEWADDDLSGRGTVEVRPATGMAEPEERIGLQLAAVADELRGAFADGSATVDRPTAARVMRRFAALLREPAAARLDVDGVPAVEVADVVERLVDLVAGDLADAATVAGAADRQDDIVLTAVLQAVGEVVGEHAQDVEVPAQRPPAGARVDLGGGWVWRANGKGGWNSSGDEETDMAELRVSETGIGKADIRASILPMVIETTREALRHMLAADGFVPGFAPGVPDFPMLVHPCGVAVAVEEGGTTIRYPDDNIADGEYGEGIGHVSIMFGASYGALRDVAVGLVAVVGGTAPEVTASSAQVEHLMRLVFEYGKAAALGGDTRRGIDYQ